MNRAECEILINDYLRWLKEGLRVSELESSCQIATPFLDRHNDEIEIYVERSNGGLLLTDDGYTIADLESTGMSFNTPHRQAHLKAILSGFGVREKDRELQLTATERDFPQKKHSLVQAILAVNDMFVMASGHVYSLFKEDVASFLEQRNIPIFPEFKLAGKSGFDHRFDFGLPKTAERPQRVLQAINNLTRDQALSFAFAIADVKAVRADPLDAYTFINDVEHPPGSETVSALRAYDIEPLYWSRREENYQLLNGASTG
jgi:hypothetical protein